MKKLKTLFTQFVVGAPIIAIAGASFFPLKTFQQQLLILFTLLWYLVFMLFEVLGLHF